MLLLRFLVDELVVRQIVNEHVAPSGRTKLRKKLPGGGCQLSRSVSIRATFSCYFNLQDFPFDCHQIKIMCTVYEPYATVVDDGRCLELKSGRIEFEQNLAASRTLTERFTLRDAWSLSPKLSMQIGHTDARNAEGGVVFPTFDVLVAVRRKHQFFRTNIIMPLSAFVLLSMTSIAVTPPGEGDIEWFGLRIDITLSMVLAAVAFKLVIAQSYMPAVSYTTILDKFSMFSLGFNVILIAESLGARFLYDYYPEYLDEFDLYSAIVLLSSWILITVLFMSPAHTCFMTQVTCDLEDQIFREMDGWLQEFESTPDVKYVKRKKAKVDRVQLSVSANNHQRQSPDDSSLDKSDAVEETSTAATIESGESEYSGLTARDCRLLDQTHDPPS